jgi:hypothetical protein
VKFGKFKDIAELVGIVAIVASLIFVGLQMRQEQKIALAEAFNSILMSRFEFTEAVKDDIDVWLAGSSGREMTDEERARFEILVYQLNDNWFFMYTQLVQLQSRDEIEFLVNSYARVLYNNPGALEIWRTREIALTENNLLFDAAMPSQFWKEAVEESVSILEQKDVPRDVGMLIGW